MKPLTGVVEVSRDEVEVSVEVAVAPILEVPVEVEVSVEVSVAPIVEVSFEVAVPPIVEVSVVVAADISKISEISEI